MSFLKSLARKNPFAISLYKAVTSFFKGPIFFLNYQKFCSLAGNKRFLVQWSDRYPCLEDNTKSTGFDRHYVYHTAWAARILKKINPSEHVDFSSLIYFSTLISAFIPTRFYDYRPADVKLPDLQVGTEDLLKLSFTSDSLPSISCMHVVEHIGLGRYGDPLDADGDLKAINELQRILAKGGNLLFVVPIGKPKIMFNAHRIYSYEQILSYFKNLNLIEFTLIPEYPNNGEFLINPSTQMVTQEEYACGCFWFQKGLSL